MLSKMLPAGPPAWIKPLGMTGVVATYTLECVMAIWLVIRSLDRMG